MKKYILIASLLASAPSFAMSDDCTTAIQMFEQSGHLINSATAAATGVDAKKLSESRVTNAEFTKWQNTVFVPNMSATLEKYKKYQNVDSNNPIYLGNVILVETDTYNESLGKYISTRDEKYISVLKETMVRVGNIYAELKKDCGK